MTRAAIFYGASALGCAEAPTPAPTERAVAPMQPVTSAANATEAEAIEEAPTEPLPTPRIEPDTEAEAREERADAEDLKRRQRGLRLFRRRPPPPPPPCCPPYGAPPFDFAV